MPKFRSFIFIGSFIISAVLYLQSIALYPIPHVHAATDPLYATSSATASVLDTTPSVSPNDTMAPTTPILIYPVDGAHVNDDTPEFSWTKSSDPNGNTVTYTFHLNGVATFLGISNIGNSAGVGYTARIDGGQIKLTPTNGLSDGSYNWYVAAIDPSNNQSNSTQWNLTIDRLPPTIAITDLDEYHELTLDSANPEDFEGLNFDINGAKDVILTIHTEPYATLTTRFSDANGDIVSQTNWVADASGLVYPHTQLIVGVYTLNLSAFDLAGNTVALPSFTLTVKDSYLTIPLPDVPGLPDDLTIDLPTAPTTSFPATVSQISTALSLSSITYALLAVVLLGLLTLIWNTKPNLILVDSTGRPLSNTIVYHSIPTQSSKFTPILVTKRHPISYLLSDRDLGSIHIQGLARYSTLTVRTQSATHILSISKTQKVHRIVL